MMCDAFDWVLVAVAIFACFMAVWIMTPPAVIVFECESRIAPDVYAGVVFLGASR